MVASQQTGALEQLTAQVAQRLQGALGELFPPLSSVALAHVRDVQPYLRAAIVWTVLETLTGDPETVDTQKSQTSWQDQAVTLGSALEMLVVALSIHRLLLLPTDGDSLDRALVGSTILTGDYCFSRAASMAAETESPQVVDIFSRALQQVSESSLRGLFGGVAAPHEEDILLATAGVEAMCALVDIDPQTTARLVTLGSAVAARDWQTLNTLSAKAHPAWSTLATWAEQSL